MSFLHHLIRHGILHLARELPKWMHELDSNISRHREAQKIQHLDMAKKVALAHGASPKRISTYQFEDLKTREQIYIYVYLMRAKQLKSWKWHYCQDSTCNCREVMTNQVKAELKQASQDL